MIPKNPKKIAKNLAAYPEYQELVDAEKVMELLDMDKLTSCKNYKNFIHPYDDRLRQSIHGGVIFSLRKLHDRRNKAFNRPAPKPARVRFDGLIDLSISTIKQSMIKGWRLEISFLNRDIGPHLQRTGKSLMVQVPRGMLYRAVVTRPGHLSYVMAVHRSSLSGVVVFGVSDEFGAEVEPLGKVRVGLAAVFISSEARLGLQYRWVCMGKMLKVEGRDVAPCGVSTSPEAAMAAAVRSSAKLLRDHMKG